MAPSLRFGLAVTTTPRQKKMLTDALAGQLEALNQSYTSLIEAKLILDENGKTLTAIINDSGKAFDLSVALQEAAWPTNLRFALISAPPAGAAGKESTVREKAVKTLLRVSPRCAFHFDLPAKSHSEIGMAAALVQLHGSLTAEWTEARANAVRSYRTRGKQAEVAEDLGVSQQAVSQMLRGARYKELENAEGAMREWLSAPKRTTLWPPR